EAALLRGPRPGPALSGSAGAPGAPAAASGSGMAALIRELALRCGWPEVAFLHLDVRGAGQLTEADLRLGLLLGAGIDFAAVAGLTIGEIFRAIVRPGAHAILAADLAACCPEDWRSHGAPRPTAPERLRALPWEAAGGAAAAFGEAAAAAGAEALQWPAFEEVVCRRMRGFEEADASSLFLALAGPGAPDAGLRRTPALAEGAWLAATADFPEAPPVAAQPDSAAAATLPRGRSGSRGRSGRSASGQGPVWIDETTRRQPWRG
ncbi:unnamed protein product, partial [Prorocentrum cordatum]